MGLATPTTMGEQPNLDEFIRHLQAELELAESIVDPVEQEQRQWQIEASLQEAISFSSRWKRIAELGKNPIKIVESIVKQEQQRRVNTSVASQLTGCQKCGNPLESDLDFCSSCGHIQK